MVSFPYHSHVFRDSYGSGMRIVWEAYHKGVPLLGVPENPNDDILYIHIYGRIHGSIIYDMKTYQNQPFMYVKYISPLDPMNI